MRPSGCFTSHHLALGVIWVWEPCCKFCESAIPAAYLLCSTAIRRDIRAAWCFCSCELPCRRVECFTSLLQRASLFCSCELRWRSIDCVLNPCFNALQDIFAVMNCSVLAMSAVFCSSLLTWSADNSSLHWQHCTATSKENACGIICMLCQQTSPKRRFAKVNVTSHCDVTKSIYTVTMTTIRYCSILEFSRGAYRQAGAPGITRPLHATGQKWHYKATKA